MVEYRDATANLTLGEIGARDLDNFNLVYKTCKRFMFDKELESITFFGQCVNQALIRLGVNDLQQIKIKIAQGNLLPLNEEDAQKYGDHLTKHLAEKGIYCEMRNKDHYWDKKDIERRGMYITKGNEIVYFIGSPKRMHMVKGPDQTRLILPKRLKTHIKYRVSTNVPM